MTITIKFSAQPGAYERHVQRKYDNPLLYAIDQPLSEKDIEQAREKDQQDSRVFLDTFQDTVQEAAALDGSVEADVLLDLKQQLERLYVTSASLAGDMQQHQQALSKLIDICMAGIRRGAEGDPGALKKLDDETQARLVFFKLLESTLAADLIRGDEIISAEELIPTLLSQSGPDLINSLELFEPEHLIIIIEQATHHLEKVRSTLANSDEIEKRISLIAGISQTTH